MRPGPTPRRIAVITGTRAEFGLLRPVMRAIQAHPDLQLLTIAAGAHLLPPSRTIDEVRAEFPLAATVPMQDDAPTAPQATPTPTNQPPDPAPRPSGPRNLSRAADAEALGRGITAFAGAFPDLSPHWVLVLGDRIEAFAAAAAAAVGGWPVAHIHGGDRAEGIADEAMRHAITKLAHLHLPATEQSAQRIRRMGEPPETVFVVGSPAADGLADIPPLPDEQYRDLGSPRVVFLMHPIGRPPEQEYEAAAAALKAVSGAVNGRQPKTGGGTGLQPVGPVLALHPNHDPGRGGILRAILEAERAGAVRVIDHLPRDRFIGLLKRLAGSGGLLAGNSSAGLIEAAVLGLPAVDIGPRQGGRERPGNVVHAEGESAGRVADAVAVALGLDRNAFTHPYGDGRTGPRIARLLAELSPPSTRKHCTY